MGKAKPIKAPTGPHTGIVDEGAWGQCKNRLPFSLISGAQSWPVDLWEGCSIWEPGHDRQQSPPTTITKA